MRISKAKLNRRNKLFKIILPIIAILGAIGGYFVLRNVYINGGYKTYTEECKLLANVYCVENTEGFRSRGGISFGGSRYRGSSRTSNYNSEYKQCVNNYMNDNCEPYYSGLGYAILAHIVMVAILTSMAYFFIWITHN